MPVVTDESTPFTFGKGEVFGAGSDVTVSLALVFNEAAKSEPLPLQGRVVWCSPLV